MTPRESPGGAVGIRDTGSDNITAPVEPGMPNSTYPEDPHLALVYHSIHPDYAVFSVGNSVLNLESYVYPFLPESSGLLNRGFQDITPDGQTYGFQTESWSSGGELFDGVIIVRMPDAETMWIEALQNDDVVW